MGLMLESRTKVRRVLPEQPRCRGMGRVSRSVKTLSEVTQLSVGEGGQGLLTKSAVGERNRHAPRRTENIPAPVETLCLEFVFCHPRSSLQLQVVPPGQAYSCVFGAGIHNCLSRLTHCPSSVYVCECCHGRRSPRR